ncbi:MAG: hypothetical protein IJD61_03890, partial [Clostridia bacterium]|nr:hypothetical protein [Clostridia bacterium]
MLKRIFPFILALAMIFSMGGALASSSASAAIVPVSMTVAGEGTITVTLLNENQAAEDGTGTPLTDIVIYSPMYPEMYFASEGVSVPAGESKGFSCSYLFTEEMLDTDIPLSVSWIDGDNAKGKDLTVKVQRTKAAAVTLTRVASSKQASPGEEITLTYTVTNTGMTPVTVTSLVDRAIGGKESILKEKVTIEGGAKHDLQYVYKMGRNTVESAPVLTYKDEATGEEMTAEASPITLGMISSKISVEVLQGEATANGVMFTLNLTNNGNQRISGIVITDDLGNRVNPEAFALAVGESRQLTYNVLTDTERYVVFNISGETAAGDDYEDKTKSYVVRKYIDPSLLGIQLTASVTETLNSAGSVEVKFDINNTGTMEMKDLVISEVTTEIAEDGTEQQKLTELYRTDTIPTGAFSVPVTLYVGQPRDLAFLVEMKDPAGNPYTYNAYVTAEYLGVGNVEETPQAQQSAINTLGASVGDSISRALTVALIVLAALVVISVVAMIVLSALEKKQRREAARRRAARERRARLEQDMAREDAARRR